MFRKVSIAITFAAALALADCAGVVNPITNQPITVAGVTAASIQACSFVPDASVVAGIISQNDPTVAGVSEIAKMICDVVTASQSSNHSGRYGAGTVNGVVITGHFAKKGAHAATVNGVVITGHFVK